MAKTPVPAPVEVQNPDPIPVVVEVSKDPLPVVVHAPEATPAQTTALVVATSAKVDASILRTEDQRRISGMWERTQQIIALSVVEATLVVASLLVITPALGVLTGVTLPSEVQTAATGGMIFLASVANLVIGFYFGRTNHSRVGGASDLGMPTRDA